ncbi:hypothetical protein [Metamycoplasma hyosynoviae]|uniref:hypothetical protein n=1 Tax=Metamycoplasma hyosynoviae TaxID=29559 RepID=UPI00235E03C4|nr:hypothetical protein [Metamycoplasma hyosynoviae]MDD1371878.1 hypothetical protein [Metamycoplasma hyosynoviae]
MKSLYLFLNNITSIATTTIAPVSYHAPQQLEGTEQQIDKIEEEKVKKMVDISSELVKENEDLFNNLSEKMNSDISTKKIMNSINEDEKDKVIDEIIAKYEKQNVLNYEQLNAIKNNKNEFKKKFFKEVRKNLLSEKKEKKSNLTKLNKETKSYYKRIVTDIKNKFAVNDDGNESSKNILEQIERFEKLLNDIETKLKPLIKKNRQFKKNFNCF